MEALEEIFKRLSFKTIDLESSTFDDETTAATLFDILDYYDTCEKLILANARSINLYGWQSLAKFIRKVSDQSHSPRIVVILRWRIYLDLNFSRASALNSSTCVVTRFPSSSTSPT